jgi:hypothetical protein
MPESCRQLPGSAPEGQWGFEDEEGNRLNGGEATFPILQNIDDNRYQFVGTGFFITDMGLFATAKHVVEPFDQETLVAWQFLPNREYLPRPIQAFSCHHTCDVAVGKLGPGPRPFAPDDGEGVGTRPPHREPRVGPHPHAGAPLSGLYGADPGGRQSPSATATAHTPGSLAVAVGADIAG